MMDLYESGRFRMAELELRLRVRVAATARFVRLIESGTCTLRPWLSMPDGELKPLAM